MPPVPLRVTPLPSSDESVVGDRGTAADSNEGAVNEVPAAVDPTDVIWNTPNIITLVRLFASLVLFSLMSAGGLWQVCAGLFLVAVITDIVDGWIARQFGLVTTFGRIMDPLVDKVITGGSFIFLLPLEAESGISAWVVTLVIFREMVVTSLRGFLESRRQDFSASATGKLKMFLQSASVTAAMLSLDPHVRSWAWTVPIRDLLVLLMVLVTVYSGIVYVVRATALLQAPQALPPGT